MLPLTLFTIFASLALARPADLHIRAGPAKPPATPTTSTKTSSIPSPSQTPQGSNQQWQAILAADYKEAIQLCQAYLPPVSVKSTQTILVGSTTQIFNVASVTSTQPGKLYTQTISTQSTQYSTSTFTTDVAQNPIPATETDVVSTQTVTVYGFPRVRVTETITGPAPTTTFGGTSYLNRRNAMSERDLVNYYFTLLKTYAPAFLTQVCKSITQPTTSTQVFLATSTSVSKQLVTSTVTSVQTLPDQISTTSITNTIEDIIPATETDYYTLEPTITDVTSTSTFTQRTFSYTFVSRPSPVTTTVDPAQAGSLPQNEFIYASHYQCPNVGLTLTAAYYFYQFGSYQCIYGGATLIADSNGQYYSGTVHANMNYDANNYYYYQPSPS